MKTEKLLLQKRSEIDQLDTTELRAKTLLEILKTEYKNNVNIDLLLAAKKGLVEMHNEMNKSEILAELDFLIKIISKYQEIGNFDLIAIPMNKSSKELSDKLESLKSLMINIIIKK